MTTDPASPTKLALDFGEIRDVTVIGVGPVGMCTAFWAGMRGASRGWPWRRPSTRSTDTKIQPKYSTNTGFPGSWPASPEMSGQP